MFLPVRGLVDRDDYGRSGVFRERGMTDGIEFRFG